MIGSLSFQADMEILNGSHLSPGTTKHSFYHTHSESQEGRDSLLVEPYTSLRVRLQLKETARHGESSYHPFGHTPPPYTPVRKPLGKLDCSTNRINAGARDWPTKNVQAFTGEMEKDWLCWCKGVFATDLCNPYCNLLAYPCPREISVIYPFKGDCGNIIHCLSAH